MSTAIFEALNSDESVGILRVYEGRADSTLPYKFFTVVKIVGSIATYIGLNNCCINVMDARAMVKELKKLGVVRVEWIHHEKLYIYKIKQE